MKKSDFEIVKKRIEELEKIVNGGKGSGNFGHSGRPGQVGGSGDGVGAGIDKKDKKSDTMETLQKEFKDKKLGEKASTVKEQKQRVKELEEMLPKIRKATTGDVIKDADIYGRFSEVLREAKIHLAKLEEAEKNK